MSNQRLTKPRAFTLLELLVVISIITLLVAVLLPTLGAARRAAQSVVCKSNQRQTTLALLGYTHDNHGRLVAYSQRQNQPRGVLWWFGFEAGGPGHTLNRPLDKTQSPLAPYFGGDIQQGLACPAFPRHDPAYRAKFETSSAHFGYNGGLVWPVPIGAKPHRLSDVDRPSSVFAFADAVHQDFDTSIFYEPHTVGFRRPGRITGVGHYRHEATANVAMLDGHVQSQRPVGPRFETLAGSPTANLDASDGPGTAYGFETWTAR